MTLQQLFTNTKKDTAEQDKVRDRRANKYKKQQEYSGTRQRRANKYNTQHILIIEQGISYDNHGHQSTRLFL